MDQRILIFGRGHLGSYLASVWPTVLHLPQDIGSISVDYLKEFKPALVVNTAAKTDLSWCEKNHAEAFRCNVSAPLSLYRAVSKAYSNCVPFVHISTGCVWDGPFKPDGASFGPKDPVDPQSFYAWTKACCDALLCQECQSPVLILRPRQLYSPAHTPRNLLHRILGYEKLLDTPNSITSCQTVAKTIEMFMLSQKFDEPFPFAQIQNVYDIGPISPFHVGCMLFDAGLRTQPEQVSRANVVMPAPKRVDVVMDDYMFELHVKPPHIVDELRRVIEQYRKWFNHE